MSDKLIKLLDAANDRLKLSNTGIKIYKRGKKLSLRGVLPPKPGKKKPSQQIISLKIFFNAAGIKAAEKTAIKISSQLTFNAFTWDEWLGPREEEAAKQPTVADMVKDFRADYFNRRKETPQSLTTWNGDYMAMYKRLPQDEELTEAVLLKLVLETEPDTRTRRRAVLAASKLAEFTGIKANFKRYSGKYSHLLGNRVLPTDDEIVATYWSIPNPKWQYVYGLMAAYGISNHEVFYADLSSLQAGSRLISDYRKNHYGVRRIWCLYPEWYEEWELYKKKPLPNVSGKDNRALGQRVTSAMDRYGIKRPGDLRHCWSIRATLFLPDSMAAKMQAHTVEEHNRTYKHWIDKKKDDKFFEILMNRDDLPKAPKREI